jgi:hypothetical protein
MKKIFAFIVALCVALSLCACMNEPVPTPTPTPAPETTAPVETVPTEPVTTPTETVPVETKPLTMDEVLIAHLDTLPDQFAEDLSAIVDPALDWMGMVKDGYQYEIISVTSDSAIQSTAVVRITAVDLGGTLTALAGQEITEESFTKTLVARDVVTADILFVMEYIDEQWQVYTEDAGVSDAVTGNLFATLNPDAE